MNKTSNKSRTSKGNMRGKQGRKDSKVKRVNFPNERVSKFDESEERYEKRTQKNSTPRSVSDRSAKGCNDIAWYSHNPELLKAASTLPTGTILGTGLDFTQQNGVTANPVIPGIMRISYTYAFGGSDRLVALNQAARSTYSYLVHANSRNYNYTASDLMILILAGAQVFSAMAYVIRAYGIAKTYITDSLYTPDGYLMAMGFDPEDFRSNLSNAWFDINDLIARSSQIWIPNTFPIISRWFWLNTNIYMDAETAKPQTYMFVPDFFLQYSPTSLDTGSALVAAGINDLQTPLESWEVFSTKTQHSWSDWKTLISNMIDALITDQDRGMIYGDILNAYGKDKLYAMAPITADYTISPVYNAEVLTQIENIIPGNNYTYSSYKTNFFGVTGLVQDQDLDELVPVYGDVSNRNPAANGNPYPDIPSGTSTTNANGVTPYEGLLNFHQVMQPTPDQIVIATRLTSLGTFKTNLRFWCTPKENPDNKHIDSSQSGWLTRVVGSEVVSGISVVSRIPKPTASKPDKFELTQISLTGGSQYFNNVEAYQKLMAFDWHPFLYLISGSSMTGTNISVGTQSGYVANALGEFSNYTKLSQENLRKINDMCMFSLFGVPQI